MDLHNLVVVEIASVLAGPSVGMFFSELGARVIKIESTRSNGDVTRSWKLPQEDSTSNVSAYFSAVNYKKEYYFFDFKDKTDYSKTIDYIKLADILIVNFKKGDDVKFDLDYDSVKKINKRLIYGAITGFGTSSDRVAYDLILQAETGFMSMNGSVNSGPVKMPVALIDVLAGHQLKQGILIALLNRGETGCLITVSLYDTAIASLANQASNFLMTGHIPQPIGSLHPNIAPYGEIFKTKDGHQITFAIGNNKQFEHLLDYLDLKIIGKKFKNNADRVKNRAELEILIASKILEFNLNDLLSYCHSNFIPVAEIKNLKQVFSDSNAERLVLNETINGVKTSRVKTVAFKIKQ